MPSDRQAAVGNGFNPTIASLSSAMVEFLTGFSILFMLMNGVFTNYFLLSSSPFSLLVKALLFSVAIEGVYRIFSIVLGKIQSAGSIFYSMLEFSAILFVKIVKLRSMVPNNLFRTKVCYANRAQETSVSCEKLDQKTPEEKKQKEIAENFKKFIEYGMDQPALTWEK